MVAGEAEQPLTLQEAAELGGYTVDRLGELLRKFPELNAGKKGAPRILRKHVLVRPERVVELAREERARQEDARRPQLVTGAKERRTVSSTPSPGASSSAGARARRAALSTRPGG
ncbi:MAG: hypothetical protein JO040_10555 [Gemmatimonadetes bacterium]|nr:hypothetical protein [Gemmatimonadota bacterium]